MKRDIAQETLHHFLDEAQSQLGEVRRQWQAFRNGDDSTELLEEMRRSTHRMKGEASIIGLYDFSHVAAFQEELFDELQTQGKNESREDVIEQCIHALETFVNDVMHDDRDEQAGLAAATIAYRRFRELPESRDEEELNQLIYSVQPPTQDDAATTIDPQMLAAYRMEAVDHLQVVSDALARSAELDQEDVLQVRRAVHSIKGGASAAGLQVAADLSHQIEDLLDRISEEDASLVHESASVITEAVDALGMIIEEEHIPDHLDDVLKKLRQEISRFPESPAVDTGSVAGGGDTPEGNGAAATSDAHIANDAPIASDGSTSDANPETQESAHEASLRLQREIENDLSAPVAPELLEVYVEEAEDHIKLIYDHLNALQTDPADRDHLQAVRRSAHTLKGAAGAVGMNVVTKLSHRMEDLLDQLYDRQEQPTQEMLLLLLTTTDQLNDLSVGDYDKVSIANSICETYARYAELLTDHADEDSTLKVEINYATTNATPQGDARTTEKTAEVEQASDRHLAEPRQMLRVPLERIDDLVRTVSELIINRTTFEQRMTNFVQGVDELTAILDRLRMVSQEMETKHSVQALGHATIAPSHATAPRQVPNTLRADDGRFGEFDTLEFDRYSEFHLLSRSIGEVASDVNTVTNELRTLIGDFDSLLARQDRLSRDTQDRLMRVRMVPLAVLTTRLHRAVRVVAASQNKEVEVFIEGEQTELDKTVLEEIADPLLHLLRNAVDHGVEPTDLRIVKGKPAKASIRIRAFYQGTQAVLRISDDGAGLDVERIGETALRKGIVSQSELDAMTPQEIFPLIFVPGLSTAKELSEVSGRGVGMDIVRDKVQRLKGTIAVDSEPDKGTTFTIRLPLTLAVTRALMVVAGNEMFAIPMQSVDQIARLPRETVEQLGNDPVIRLNGTACPLIRLNEHLSLRETETNSPTIPVLIVRSGESSIAVRVERIIAGRDIVVKTLGSHLRKVPGLLGATLLGDGTVVPILDPNALTGKEHQLQVPNGIIRRNSAVSQTTSVMIVDDSVSVRKVTENLIKAQGWNAIVAKDGVDAMEVLQSLDFTPDIFLLDVEMPRMDGYELLSTLRSMEAHRETPVVMVTSRSGEKHRSKAFALGATDYLVKPYQDDQLVALVHRLASSSRESSLS